MYSTSLAVWGLAHGSPWLQTWSYNFLLTLKKLIFAGEISGSLFVSGQQYTPGPCRSLSPALTVVSPRFPRTGRNTFAQTSPEGLLTDLQLDEAGPRRSVLPAQSLLSFPYTGKFFVTSVWRKTVVVKEKHTGNC